ncbi:MAG: HlyD family efflux transporter periplasmic adaptor subunit [Bacteroidetes bacterium]|jgi:multidrug efflux pump subunit AcrA (membrane-fusion protein)|nr:HlyD family efflux transporter periplasmic adaptor subunit [Bacteroidota bacterium]
MEFKKKYLYPIGLLLTMFIIWLTIGSESSDENVIYTEPIVGYFEVTITSSGELQAQNSTSISAPENMRQFRINNVPILNLVPEGTVVEKGEFVAELDRSSLSNTLQDAQLSLEEEETQLEQAKLDSTLTLSAARNNIVDLEYSAEQSKLVVEQSQYESPAVQRQAQIEYEQAERRLQQARENYQTQVKQAEANVRGRETEVQEERNDVQRIQEIMNQFTIYAPENGMVIYKRNRDGSKVKVGSSISAWDPTVAELPDFSIMESLTYINEVDIQKVRTGQRVDLGLDAMPEKQLTGQVTSVANIGEQRPNSNSKVFQVTIRVNEADSTLRPSMTTSNTIHISSVDSALYVPLETIHAYNDMDVVYKREGQSAVMQQIVMGIMNENDVVIHEGVDLSDQLYLSLPVDTTGIERRYLPSEILLEYETPEEIAQQE